MRARFLNGKHAKLSIIVCYAPTNDADEEDKDAFYRRLQEEVEKVPTHDVLCVIGDLNAKVGDVNSNREQVMGRQGCGTMNDNGKDSATFAWRMGLLLGVLSSSQNIFIKSYGYLQMARLKIR